MSLGKLMLPNFVFLRKWSSVGILVLSLLGGKKQPHCLRSVGTVSPTGLLQNESTSIISTGPSLLMSLCGHFLIPLSKMFLLFFSFSLNVVVWGVLLWRTPTYIKVL